METPARNTAKNRNIFPERLNRCSILRFAIYINFCISSMPVVAAYCLRMSAGRFAMLDVSVGGALLAGLLSFVSPCVLPLVPPYLAWLAGVSFDELKSDSLEAERKRRIVLSALAFVLGFTTVFVALGATASAIGRTVAQYFDVLAVLAGIIIVI